ncbi:MAG: thioredoxin domain-containing protein, partial [Gemmatimonadetes bacterium]|nr:thioredoxin domain-containing protein [Gemmatimonadota bacterium]
LHAHNPVEWYPWGPEALQRARDEDKPIFLSVGYSTCYWCHVMERKVFSNVEIAAIMNRDFINIKVDREERPDLDRLYMTATQLMTGRGGWPNSVFLTPDLRPFYAGTYFPPEDHPGRPGFPRVLASIRDAWVEKRDQVEQVATRLQTEIAAIQAGSNLGEAPTRALVEAAVSAIHGRFDETNGGFGAAPKFPPAIDLELLLDQIEAGETGESQRMVTATLTAMAAGGLRDHVGGGFHRYATDARWRVPHFEKMLYNQAQLARIYARASVLMGEPRWRLVTGGILDFVLAELTSPEGAFYTALDAEVDGVEGSFYTWTATELNSVLGEQAASRLLGVYDLEPVPEAEGGHALFLRTSAQTHSHDDASIRATLKTLHDVRSRRDRPRLDDKILTGWNGLMIAAAADVGRWLEDERAIAMAEDAAIFAWSNLRREDGRLWRSWRLGRAYQEAFLEDYAFLAQGLEALALAKGDTIWHDRAAELVSTAVGQFGDAVSGGFYNTTSAQDLIVRSKSGVDSALPSANAVMTHVLLQMAERDPRRLPQAWRTLIAFGGGMRERPVAYTHLIAAAGHALRLGPAAAVFEEAPLVTGEILQVIPSRPSAGHVVDIRVQLKIVDGWHINSNPASVNLLPTSLALTLSGAGLRIDEVAYPEGSDHVIAELAETLSVWSGTVELTAHATALTPGSGTLTAVIDYQACDDRRCLTPTQFSTTVELEID